MKKYIIDNSLVGRHSKFNQELFEKYDIPARAKIKEALGEFVIDNPDKYKQDLVITDQTCKYKYIELQVCSNWVNDKFPHDKVYVYERKYHYDNDTLFITLNKSMTKGVLFDAKSFKANKPRRIKKYSREFVYDVPWNKILPFSMDDLCSELIKLYNAK
jgi:hypothetical protein